MLELSRAEYFQLKPCERRRAIDSIETLAMQHSVSDCRPARILRQSLTESGFDPVSCLNCLEHGHAKEECKNRESRQLDFVHDASLVTSQSKLQPWLLT